MTQFTFILYLEWLLKIFPNQRSLLIVDRYRTHYGELITDWLSANHASESNGKIFVEFILEGLTSIHQVCDSAINKPLKIKIKAEYYGFRQASLEGRKRKILSAKC
mgnify:CR=1 FL=1